MIDFAPAIRRALGREVPFDLIGLHVGTTTPGDCFYTRILKLQVELGVTQKQACSQVGLCIATLHNLRKGKGSLTRKMIFKLEKAELAAGILDAGIYQKEGI